ncbi:MAG: UDP-N-acetylmuramoyl-L-alanyl-D-glutamate--2,6-diaminopimelate ligase [Candidatus Omnitrophota bacterium]|nr:UDP-N-acetylmuramoyl-L-alanyl-D-glutamate--2,6-diaminopimelate ligase [Candidatus Omnitrophota bacterium]
MKLRLILPQLDKELLDSFGNIEIKGISCNSQSVSNDYIFVAIRGTKLDANRFIYDAINKGARIIISDSIESFSQSKKAVFIKVKDCRETLSKIAANFYGRPSEKIKVIGITGTNGKTTISYLLENILQKAGFDVGVIGTINYRFKNRLIPAINTTPGPLEIQSLLNSMLKEKLKYAVMEVSSHSLDQKRVLHVNFQSAIFTNLTAEHLDYHPNLENYFQAKAKLFKNLNKTACAIVNLDDKYAKELIKITPADVLTYGIIHKDADVRAEELCLTIDGAKFKLITKDCISEIKTDLVGKHNVYNILAAISLALAEKIDLNIIRQAIEGFKGVPGRLEEVKSGLNFRVFVDFAHTPDALKNVLTSLKEFNPARIILVFGCGGDRDRIKRPLMGKIASCMADFSIITSDNPRSEDPQSIADQIIQGMSSKDYKIILDRKEAIKEALSLARKDDLVLIAGRGHEAYQVFKDITIAFDDRQEVKNILECLK